MTYEIPARQARQASLINLQERQAAAAETAHEKRLRQEEQREKRSGLIHDKVAERVEEIGRSIDHSIGIGNQRTSVCFYARYADSADELSIEDEANRLTRDYFTELGYTVAVEAEQGIDYGKAQYIDAPGAGFPAYVTTFNVSW